MLTLHAARTLYEARLPTLPSGFLAQVERVHEVAMEQAIVEQNNDSLAKLTEALTGPRIRA
jgi:hypothetical protein